MEDLARRGENGESSLPQLSLQGYLADCTASALTLQVILQRRHVQAMAWFTSFPALGRRAPA